MADDFGWKKIVEGCRRVPPSARLCTVKRGTIAQLLAEEEAKLAKLNDLPVCRPHINDFPCFRLNPSTQDAPAGKHQRVRAVRVKDVKLKITVEWRCRYRVPTERGHSDLFFR
jgi:hypothetical protein